MQILKFCKFLPRRKSTSQGSGSMMLIPDYSHDNCLSKKKEKHIQRLQKYSRKLAVFTEALQLLKKINILQYLTVLQNTIHYVLLHVIFFFKEVVMDCAVQELKYLIHNHNIYLAFKV